MISNPGSEVQILDENGNPINGILDGGIRRLAVDSNVTVSALNFKDGPNLDAFQRLRVSNPLTIFDSKQIFDNQALFWDDSQISGAGTTSVHSPLTASTVIGVSLNTAGRRIRQTFMRFNYEPGKSQLVFMTGTLGSTGGGTGIKRSMGFYNDDNGIFMIDDEGVVKAVIRSNTTGTPIDTEVAQTVWNLDKLDGLGGATNPSGLTLDATKSQITITDFEWLGVGRVRIGFVLGGRIIYVHEFLHSNVLEGVYMSTPNLPLRYEIVNDGTGAASSLEHICTTVISEGGKSRTGLLRHKSTEGSHINANTTNIIYAIVGIRLKTTHLGMTIFLEKASVVNSTSDDYEWMIILNPVLENAITFSNETNSGVQTGVGNPGGHSNSRVTGGTQITGGMVKASGTAGSFSEPLENALRLGASIAGVRDELYLCVRPLSANANIDGNLDWRELQ